MFICPWHFWSPGLEKNYKLSVGKIRSIPLWQQQELHVSEGGIAFPLKFALSAEMEMTHLAGYYISTLYIKRKPVVAAKHSQKLMITYTTAMIFCPIEQYFCSPASPRREVPDIFGSQGEKPIWIYWVITTVYIDTHVKHWHMSLNKQTPTQNRCKQRHACLPHPAVPFTHAHTNRQNVFATIFKVWYLSKLDLCALFPYNPGYTSRINYKIDLMLAFTEGQDFSLY